MDLDKFIPIDCDLKFKGIIEVILFVFSRFGLFLKSELGLFSIIFLVLFSIKLKIDALASSLNFKLFLYLEISIIDLSIIN